MSERSRKIIDDACRRMVAEGGATGAEAIVCMGADAPGFDDDKFDWCKECGTRVRYRPYMPDLPKLCLGCYQTEPGAP